MSVTVARLRINIESVSQPVGNRSRLAGLAPQPYRTTSLLLRLLCPFLCPDTNTGELANAAVSHYYSNEGTWLRRYLGPFVRCRLGWGFRILLCRKDDVFEDSNR